MIKRKQTLCFRDPTGEVRALCKQSESLKFGNKAKKCFTWRQNVNQRHVNRSKGNNFENATNNGKQSWYNKGACLTYRQEVRTNQSVVKDSNIWRQKYVDKMKKQSKFKTIPLYSFKFTNIHSCLKIKIMSYIINHIVS